MHSAARQGLTLALGLSLLGAAAARPITIAFRERVLKLGAPPVLRAGRILVPARPVFTALGASVFYDPRSRLLAVRRAGRTAIVNGAAIIAKRSYVPLRAITQALDLDVAYDARTRRVDILERYHRLAVAPTVSGRPIDGPTVEERHPQANEQIYSGFPAVYATVQTHGGPAVDRSSVRIKVDGVDVTSRSEYVGEAITYTPTLPFLAGPHNVTVAGQDLGGLAFAQSWTFFSRYNPAQEANTVTPSIFVPGGSYAYNDRVIITALGPAGGYGYVTIPGLGTFTLVPQYSQPGYYLAIIIVPANIYLPHAYVSGYIIAGGRRYTLHSRRRLFIDSTNRASYATPLPRATLAPAPLPTALTRTPVPPPPPRVPR